jgi:biotin carboxylase
MLYHPEKGSGGKQQLSDAPGLLCISSYEKGQRFLSEAARLGADTMLLTREKLAAADWPRESLSVFHTVPDDATPEQVIDQICYIARGRRIDRIVALDEFDLETAAHAREHMRLAGMGQTATRFFRDKLAMRTQARARGVAVPDFTGVFHYDDIRAYMASVPAPWLLKPRTNAAAIGIKPISDPERLWRTLDELGDLQTHYVLERFVPGEVYHVEGVTWQGEVLFAAPHRYGKPPMQTMHQGGVFTTRSLDPATDEAQALLSLHRDVLRALGMLSGVTHTEFIRSAASGRFYFLETAARVGGAHIADVVEAACGLNPWAEWARIEVASATGSPYALPELHPGHAGSVISLARQETPDTSAYDAPEIVTRLNRPHHAGLILRSDSVDRLHPLIDDYASRFLDDFCAVVPPPLKPTS